MIMKQSSDRPATKAEIREALASAPAIAEALRLNEPPTASLPSCGVGAHRCDVWELCAKRVRLRLWPCCTRAWTHDLVAFEAIVKSGWL